MAEKRYDATATTVGNYALFGGGKHSGDNLNTVEVFDFNLTKSSAAGLIKSISAPNAITLGDYALFGVFDSFNVDAYNSFLTKISVQPLSKSFELSPAMATVGNYALFGAGYTYPTSTTDVEAYTQKDASIVKLFIHNTTSNQFSINYYMPDGSESNLTIGGESDLELTTTKGSSLSIGSFYMRPHTYSEETPKGFLAEYEETLYINPKYPKNTLEITFT